jgi:hypothetical protein
MLVPVTKFFPTSHHLHQGHQHFQLMVDPAVNMLVDKASLQSFAMVSLLTTASSSSPVAAEDPAALPTITGPQSPVNSHWSSVTGLRVGAASSSSPATAVDAATLPTVTNSQSAVISHRSSGSSPGGSAGRAFGGQL